MSGTPVPTVEQHLDAVLSVAGPLEELEMGLGEAFGCLLGEDLATDGPLPPVGTALAEGYAVRLADVAAATAAAPARLPVVGDVQAGARELSLSVQAGFAVRVGAGAPLPPGTEAVVPAGWTDGGLARVAVLRPPAAGAWCRRAGDDLAAGAPLLPRGARLGPPQVALLAAAGRSRVLVRPRPRVVVVSTGRGLVELGQRAAPGETVDANSHALALAAREAGAQPYRVGVLPDDPRRLLEALEDHLIRADLVLASGGGGGATAGGGGDVVAEVLARLGSVRTGPVAVRPGGTFAVGTVGPDATPYVGLPGHPLSALVGFELFARPALRRMLGLEPLYRPRVEVELGVAVRSVEGLRQYVPCVLARPAAGRGRPVATPLPGSLHPLQGLGAAAALVVVPGDVTELAAGALAAALLLERRST